MMAQATNLYGDKLGIEAKIGQVGEHQLVILLFTLSSSVFGLCQTVLTVPWNSKLDQCDTTRCDDVGQCRGVQSLTEFQGEGLSAALGSSRLQKTWPFV